MNETSGHLETADGERLAWRRTPGVGPTVVWLGGYRSDMTGTKAQAIADWAQDQGQAYLRFDYFAHGASTGVFAKGTITRWREDVLAMIDSLTAGPLVLVGSSMGGWLACLAAMAKPERMHALVLVAPAPDFTEKLVEPHLTLQARAAIREHGVWLEPSPYGEPNPITRELLEDGARWSILPGPVPIEARVRILQGGEDPDVPWTHALELAHAIKSPDVVFTLVKDGDHRLSRPADVARLIAALAEACA